MKKISRTNRFKKDVKKMKKRGKSFDVFKQVIQLLAQGQPLDEKFRDHKLIGNYVGTRECHIEPDWLLIYEDHDDELILIRTGTHSDLFG
ncbi:MAG: type II toxin-antitoxin system YafQ family toxin [Bacteroidia bacterium]|nr:MAG: type II toxin-antitoxin system YafQ family toxin [Bacteroidia bacterium]